MPETKQEDQRCRFWPLVEASVDGSISKKELENLIEHIDECAKCKNHSSELRVLTRIRHTE
jgi:hypothetical protein